MGVQLISDRKMRIAAGMTGLGLFRVLRHSNRLWFGFVARGKGHWHVIIDPLTWEWSVDESAFSSCDDYGPHVDPPIGLARLCAKASLFQEETEKADRLLTTLRFYADQTTYADPPEATAEQLEYGWEPTVPIEDDKGALARAAIAAEEEEEEEEEEEY